MPGKRVFMVCKAHIDCPHGSSDGSSKQGRGTSVKKVEPYPIDHCYE